MSIENVEGIDNIEAALSDLRVAYLSLLKMEKLPADVSEFAYVLTREEVKLVLEARIARLKSALKHLGFTKPTINVTGDRDAPDRQTAAVSGVATLPPLREA